MSEAPEQEIFPRIKVKGWLTLASPLMVRTGEQERTAPDKDVEGAMKLAIELDADGKPVIPASAFKGIVRHQLASAFDRNDELAKEIDLLFGSLPVAARDGEDDSGTGGIFEFHNLRCGSGNMTAAVRERGSTVIGAATRTAKRRLLRTMEQVEAGTEFAFEVVGQRVTLDQAALLVAGLQRAAREGALGSAGNAGNGEFRIKGLEVAPESNAEVTAWFLGGALKEEEQDAIDAWRKKKQREILELAEGYGEAATSARDPLCIEIVLEFDGPFLVAEARPDSGTGEPDITPYGAPREGFESMLPKGTAVLPGSSFRGALSSQCKRIYRTLARKAVTLREESGACGTPIERLFGKTGWAGRLRLSDFTLIDDRPLVTREMVAIDRFTGGARDAAKFSIQVIDRPRLCGHVELETRDRVHPAASGKRPVGVEQASLEDGDVGLLALALRDLAEGDVTLGYGATKGFGHCRIVSLRVVEAGANEDIAEALSALSRLVERGEAKQANQRSDRLAALVAAFRSSVTPQEATG
ncbi:MAG: hypothetical protein D6773_07675 [Alphaproteobacteria bacterium]|nr:MAG: hypothetical protein D6773_07675 [Alphaproteobacteria bacterium]